MDAVLLKEADDLCGRGVLKEPEGQFADQMNGAEIAGVGFEMSALLLEVPAQLGMVQIRHVVDDMGYEVLKTDGPAQALREAPLDRPNRREVGMAQRLVVLRRVE